MNFVSIDNANSYKKKQCKQAVLLHGEMQLKKLSLK